MALVPSHRAYCCQSLRKRKDLAGAVRFANAHLDAERDANVCGALCVNAHLSDDGAVAKMGHPDCREALHQVHRVDIHHDGPAWNFFAIHNSQHLAERRAQHVAAIGLEHEVIAVDSFEPR